MFSDESMLTLTEKEHSGYCLNFWKFNDFWRKVSLLCNS